jgi:lysophospholipid acyltransferase (LPLAT)-like uncharacterized protein
MMDSKAVSAPAPTQPIKYRKRIQQATIVFLAYWLIRILTATWRVRVVDQTAGFTGPRICVAWHENIASLASYGLSIRKHLTLLVSASRDGEAGVRVAKKFGLETLRGSSSRRSLAALREVIRASQAGRWIGLLVDGPRGPAREPKPGASMTSAITGVPVVPVAAHVKSFWRLNSWDRTIIPFPFTKIEVIVGEPIPPPSGTDRKEIKRHSQAIADALSRL